MQLLVQLRLVQWVNSAGPVLVQDTVNEFVPMFEYGRREWEQEAAPAAAPAADLAADPDDDPDDEVEDKEDDVEDEVDDVDNDSSYQPSRPPSPGLPGPHVLVSMLFSHFHVCLTDVHIQI